MMTPVVAAYSLYINIGARLTYLRIVGLVLSIVDTTVRLR